ncbi:glycosyltransferase family 1 protein [Clostridiales bacterium]|nr:glycosyltransferase family 1 protein [Clostridiales bacterium]
MDEPIRILQVVTHMNRGGLETMVMNYYRKIDRSRVQFDFLTHRPESEKKDYDEEIKSLGGKIYHIQELNPFSLRYRASLKTFFEEHPEYRVIHVHQDCLSSVILKVAKECGVKTRIAHCHSSNQDINIKYPIKLYYKRFIATYATDLMSCGKKSGEWMFGKSSKFTILPNAIDTGLFVYSEGIRNSVRTNLGFNKSDIVIGHVGRFSKVKNHSFMIDLFKLIHGNNENYKMVFVGDGILMRETINKAEQLGLKVNEDIIFLGLRSDVPELMQAMDIFLLPSKYEGMPMSIVEAQSTGLRCFISDKVPYDCVLTNLVTQLSLKLSIERWADEIMKSCIVDRNQYQSAIIEAGYDITKNAKFLENYYLSKYESEE